MFLHGYLKSGVVLDTLDRHQALKQIKTFVWKGGSGDRCSGYSCSWMFDVVWGIWTHEGLPTWWRGYGWIWVKTNERTLAVCI